MKKQRLYHYIDNGKVIRVLLPIDQEPAPHLIKGMGPIDPAMKQKQRDTAKRNFAGIPKSPEQKLKMRQSKLGIPKSVEHKLKMSQAKLGVPKSPEHKENMKLSQLAKAVKVRQVMAEHNVGYREAQNILKTINKDNI